MQTGEDMKYKKMKKGQIIFTVLCVASMSRFSVTIAAAPAEEVMEIRSINAEITKDIITHEIEDGQLLFDTQKGEIVGGKFEVDKDSLEISLTIPSDINGIPVVGIGNQAFVSLRFKTLIFPDTLEYIDSDTFNECKLPVVTIPDNVKRIGGGAFAYCWGENEIIMGKNVEEIGRSAFFESKTKSMILPDTLTSIGARAFQRVSIKDLIIPDSVEEIGEYAFAESGIKNLTIGKGVKSIGKNIFDSTERVTTFVEKDSYAHKYMEENNLRYKFIGENPFDWTEYVVEGSTLVKYTGTDSVVVIPEDVLNIGPKAFQKNTSLAKVIFHEYVSSIGSKAFAGCMNLEDMVFLSEWTLKISSIEDDAFADTKWLLNQKKEEEPIAKEPEKEEKYIKVKVKKGDSLWKLSQKYLKKGSKYKEIMKLNNLKNIAIKVGQTLTIPVQK